MGAEPITKPTINIPERDKQQPFAAVVHTHPVETSVSPGHTNLCLVNVWQERGNKLHTFQRGVHDGLITVVTMKK